MARLSFPSFLATFEAYSAFSPAMLSKHFRFRTEKKWSSILLKIESCTVTFGSKAIAGSADLSLSNNVTCTELRILKGH